MQTKKTIKIAHKPKQIQKKKNKKTTITNSESHKKQNSHKNNYPIINKDKHKNNKITNKIKSKKT